MVTMVRVGKANKADPAVGSPDSPLPKANALGITTAVVIDSNSSRSSRPTTVLVSPRRYNPWTDSLQLWSP